MIATWYVTEAGVSVDPAECAVKDGALVHKSGAKIAMRFPDCPRSRSVDVDAVKAGAKKASEVKPVAVEPVVVPAAEVVVEVPQETAPEAAPETKDVKPEAGAAKRGYRTRETKAE